MSFCDGSVRLDVGEARRRSRRCMPSVSALYAEGLGQVRRSNKGVLAMQYLLMIYQNEVDYGKIDAATSKKSLEEYGAFTQSIIQSGNFKAGDRLQPTTPATMA